MSHPAAAAPEFDSTPAAPAPAKTPVKKATKPRTAAKPADHPKYIAMVAAAVGSLKERGGSSRQAILKYIVANYNVGDEVTKINARIKTALKSGVTDGTLKQAKGTGATGSFRLGDKKVAADKPKPKKVMKPKTAVTKKPKSPKKVAVKKPETPTKKAAAAKPKKVKTPKKVAAAKPKKAKSPAKKAANKPKAAKPKTPKKAAAKKPAAKKAAKE